MKQIITIIGLMTVLAFSIGRNTVSMSKVGSEYLDANWARCYYQKSTQGQMKVTILFQGSQYNCPERIRYDIESGLWE